MKKILLIFTLLSSFILSTNVLATTNQYIEFVKEFPMNVAGKILKYKMREQAIEKLGLQKASKIVTA